LTRLGKWGSVWSRVQESYGRTNAEKEADVKRVFSLVLVLGVAALFSSTALAGAECNYHQTQAAVSKTDKSMVKAPVPVQDTDQVRTADAAPVAKPAPAEVKK
jgi:hypothetical protein